MSGKAKRVLGMAEDNGSIVKFADALTPVAAKVATAAAGGLIAGISESSGDLWSGLVGDRIKLWRLNNLVDGLERTARHISDKGISLSAAKPLPLGEMIAVFEGISREDDEGLADMWARLLAEAMTDEGGPSLSARSVAALLGQLSPDSAGAFRLLAKEAKAASLAVTLGRLRHRDFFPLTEEEAQLNESDLRNEYDRIEIETERERRELAASDQRCRGRLELAKSELLRLNLIDRKDTKVNFDDRPFSRGYKVNADGLDTVLGAMQTSIKTLIDSRTDYARHSFLDDWHLDPRSNFQLSSAGEGVARKLGLL